MWREMARIIGEVRPRFVFVENSPMLTSRGLGTVLRDLAQMGYDAEWGVLGAADVGANHQRDRIWLLAYTNSKSNAKRRFDSSISEIGGQRSFDEGRSRGNVDGILKSSSNEEMDTEHNNDGETTNPNCIRLQKSTNKCQLESQRSNQLQIEQSRDSTNVAYTSSQRSQAGSSDSEGGEKGQTGVFDNRSNDLAYTSIERLERSCKNWGKNNKIRENSELWGTIAEQSWWSIEPNVGRVVDGMASRVDRLKAIGNGQVPLCAATAWTILMERINGL
jgi:DNA (cytosine-5)-methyltransferase 1